METNLAIAKEALELPLFGQQRKYTLYREQILSALVLPQFIQFHCQIPYGKYSDHSCLCGMVQIRGWDLRYVYVARFSMVGCPECRTFGYRGGVAAHPFFTAPTVMNPRLPVHFKLEWQKLWVNQDTGRLWVNFFNLLSLEA